MPDVDLNVTTLAAQVARDSGVTNAEIAAACGLTESTVSRVLSGQYNVPALMIAYLYRRTGDLRLVKALLGLDGVELVPALVGDDRDATDLLLDAQAASSSYCGALAAWYRGKASCEATRAALLQSSERLIREIGALRARVGGA